MMRERESEKGRCWAALRLQSSRQTQHARPTWQAPLTWLACLMPPASHPSHMHGLRPRPCERLPNQCAVRAQRKGRLSSPSSQSSQSARRCSRVAEWQSGSGGRVTNLAASRGPMTSPPGGAAKTGDCRPGPSFPPSPPVFPTALLGHPIIPPPSIAYCRPLPLIPSLPPAWLDSSLFF
jgi:hypothetical protein